MQILSKKESRKMNKEILKWVKKTLDSDNGCEFYNILMNLKSLFERVRS